MGKDREVREKLVVRGPESLTDAELVSVIIHTGAASESSLELAEKLMSACGESLPALSKLEVGKLRNLEGLGIKRAALLAASLELGERMVRQKSDPLVITTNEDVERIFKPLISTLPYEEFWMLYLSSANSVLDKVKVSQGGSSGTAVDSKVIVKRAVELLATGMIMVHNHPSGVAIPSEDDKLLTEKIAQAASLFDIRVLDHLIVTTGESFSFRQKGLL